MAPFEHPPIVDLANFEDRKEEIAEQLMAAATNSGASSGLKVSSPTLQTVLRVRQMPDREGQSERKWTRLHAHCI